MKRLKSSDVQRLNEMTRAIYTRVLVELDDSYLGKTREEAKECIDSLYCKYLCELDSSVLEKICSAHFHFQIRRAPRTIDAIQKELLERVLNESKEGNPT